MVARRHASNPSAPGNPALWFARRTRARLWYAQGNADRPGNAWCVARCGTPVHAAASGVVQRVRYGWNYGGGNQVTILHANGVVTYYGHLMTIFVKPGEAVTTGDTIALMGGGPGMAGAGISTGCHTHFEVIGAKNPLSKYLVGTKIKY